MGEVFEEKFYEFKGWHRAYAACTMCHEYISIAKGLMKDCSDNTHLFKPKNRELGNDSVIGYRRLAWEAKFEAMKTLDGYEGKDGN